MLNNILIGAFLIVITIVIHAWAMMFVLRGIHTKVRGWRLRLRESRIYWIASIVLVMFLASLLEAFAWAVAYLLLNAVQSFEEAFYFSMVTYTTLGYGDVILGEQWRLLGSFEAANGIIIFGWSTAVIMAMVHHVYIGKDQSQQKR
jgi:hypothetical protein